MHVRSPKLQTEIKNPAQRATLAGLSEGRAPDGMRLVSNQTFQMGFQLLWIPGEQFFREVLGDGVC
jgi:hypothetical protein